MKFVSFLELDRPLQTLYAIYAGLEPESFIELFPYWVVQDDITDLQIDVCILFKLLFHRHVCNNWKIIFCVGCKMFHPGDDQRTISCKTKCSLDIN